MTALLVLEEVACLRGGRLLFEGMNLRLAAGEARCVTGPNGTGKSSLLRIAAGLLDPAAGKVQAAPAALADDTLALDREQSLGAALRFWAGLDGTEPALAKALEAFGLERLEEVPVRMLSAGQARRARLARVQASGARLWLLDEPLNGLDAPGSAQLGQAIAAHRSSGGAVLAASHVRMPGDWQLLELGR